MWFLLVGLFWVVVCLCFVLLLDVNWLFDFGVCLLYRLVVVVFFLCVMIVGCCFVFCLLIVLLIVLIGSYYCCWVGVSCPLIRAWVWSLISSQVDIC